MKFFQIKGILQNRILSIALPEENVKEISILGSSLKWSISNIILTGDMLLSVIYILMWINLLCTMCVQKVLNKPSTPL